MKLLAAGSFLVITASVASYLILHGAARLQPQTLITLPKNHLIVRGSIPYWDQNNAVKSFNSNVTHLDQVAIFWYYVNDAGNVTKYKYAEEDPTILALAKASNVKSFFTLTNLGEQPGDNWDSKRVEVIIKDENSRQAHIKDILSVFDRLDFSGVNVDFEDVDSSQRQNYSDFIRELSVALHHKGKMLTIAIHPVTDKKSAQRYYFQNLKSLAESADYLSVMAYDQHENQSKPGPIASYQWDNKIISHLNSQNLPMKKILLGLPAYGYDWMKDSDNKAADVTYPDSQKLLTDSHADLMWDDSAKAHYFKYTSSGQQHEVWYEDSKSTEPKLALAQRSGMGGVSLWRLGEEDPAIWTELQRYH